MFGKDYMKTKVFMIPYAGASSFAYYHWKKSFPNDMEPVFVELAGRGVRSNENFFKSIIKAANDVADQIMNATTESDYIIYGHSMGGLIAYETVKELEKRVWRNPLHLFVSGQVAPILIPKGESIFDYSDDDFLKLVSSYDGLPKEFFDEEIKKVFLPILRSDFTLLSEYDFTHKIREVDCSLTVFYGMKDRNTPLESIYKWKLFSNNETNFYGFEGGHFFINACYKEIINCMKCIVDNKIYNNMY